MALEAKAKWPFGQYLIVLGSWLVVVGFEEESMGNGLNLVEFTHTPVVKYG